MKKNSIIKKIALVSLLLSKSTFAADIRLFTGSDGNFQAIVIEGEIASGDYEKFLKIIRNGRGNISNVYLYSSGGNYYEAMKIGRAMRSLELSSTVPSKSPNGKPICDFGLGPKPNDPVNCDAASAAFFIHIGAVHRGGTYLAAHRPYFEKGKFGELSQQDAEKAFNILQDSAKKYMDEMGVPKHIQEDILGTPSDRILIFDDKTQKTYFSREIPYRNEWIKNRCSKLTIQESGRYETYLRRIILARNNPSQSLSESERYEFKELEKKSRDESDCAIKVDQESRKNAFEKYFGLKISDSNNSNFSEWIESSRYLGMQLNKILDTEDFEEEKLGRFHFLKRNAKNGKPGISMSGSPENPGLISMVLLASTPNPKPEFIDSPVKNLSSKWGKFSTNNQNSEWRWELSTFSAALSLERKPDTTAYAYLTLKAK